MIWITACRCPVSSTCTAGESVKSGNGGTIPHWRAIYDDEGRVMVAMCFNQDDGDAWEHADNPQYEAKYTSQAYRLGINYVIYAMTH